jgi:NADH-quinone oxidoreductase subunit N
MMHLLDSLGFMPLLPEIIMALGALVLLVVGAYSGAHALKIVWVGAQALILFAACRLYLGLPSAPIIAFDGLYIVDYFSQIIKAFILLGGLMVMVLAGDWLRLQKSRFFEAPVLMLLAMCGMMVMASSNDLLTLYMGLELSSLALYVLAASDRDNAKSSEAGLKYFVLGALASGLLLFGASLVYGYTGSTNFSAIAGLFTSAAEGQVAIAYGAVLGMVFLAVALCFKISAAPFHMWTPDVYTGAPAPITLFFATIPKIAAMAVFMRLLAQPFATMFADWQDILALAANASMIIGALGALMQTNLKRLLAYGSIGHIGYALVGVASGVENWPKVVVLYLFIYLLMSMVAFGFILFLQKKGEATESIADLSGLSKTHPLMAFMMMLIMLSMAGIPPLAGFYGKMFVFLSAIEAELYIMTVIGLLTSVIAAYYYLRVVKVMYFDAPCDDVRIHIPFLSRVVLGVCTLFIAGFFVMPSWFLKVADAASQSLF